MGEFLLNSWTYFATNVLTQPAYLIGFIVLLGYLLLRRPFYECLAGFLKATVGYFILSVGSGGLVNNFRPILVGLKERFNLQAMVTDPYFGQNAVDAGLMKTFGRTFGDFVIDRIYYEYFVGSFSKIYKIESRFYNRECSDSTSSYRFLDFTLLFS